MNEYFHGTPNAVIAAGGQSGIARWAKIHNVRVCSPEGCFGDDVVAGVDFVTQQRNSRPGEIHVANASFAGFDGTSNSAFVNSIDAGVGWVFGAGNGSADACGYYPASLAATRSGALAVGASSPTTDRIYDYSNQGSCVEIFAPGATQWATWPGNPGGSVGGTSVAAPHVTGVFAAQWANSPTSNSSEIEGLIKGVATVGVLSNRWTTSPDLLLFSPLPRQRAVSH